MNILLVHQNFPGQFRHLAPLLARNPKVRVIAFSMIRNPAKVPGLRMVTYRPGRSGTQGIHPWVADLESKVIRGEIAMKAAHRVRKELDFTPDLIFAHHGWGESLFLKDVWPKAKQLLYAEWFYQLQGGDTGFDPEFQSTGPETLARLRIKNAHNLIALEEADAAVSPTYWQRDTHPAWARAKMSVVHDGIDTRRLTRGDPPESLQLPIPADEPCGITEGQVTLVRGREVITFVNRNLEPYRGYHIFLRALPELLRRRPRAEVVIVGGNGVSYGARPPEGSWKKVLLDEVGSDLDLRRVHFVGKLPYRQFLDLLRLATVHTYLTYPFVLSWSLLEAMALECPIVASDTEPVREVITDGETGRLVPFFDGAALVERICELADDPQQRQRLGAAARAHVVEHYDLRTRCLPKQLELVRSLAS